MPQLTISQFNLLTMKHLFTFKLFLCLALLPSISNTLTAIDTFERVRTIVQAKCTNGCHNTANPSGLLNLTGSSNEVYNALVNSTPTNPAAQNKGYKRVMEGRADQSFLMKKINGGLEHNFDLEVSEGAAMPPIGASPLTIVEREMIRQWIIFGAPQSGEVTDESLIEEYYAAGVPAVSPLPTPAQNEGIQLHHGPIFMQPGHELEAFRKIDLSLPDSLDIVGFDISMNNESHHFVIYQYNPTLLNQIPKGIRISSGFGDEVVMYQNANFLDIWQFAETHIIPDIAAFKWGPNTSIDLNYHIKNYSTSNVLAAEAYINIYTRPKSPARREMKFGLKNYGGGNPFALNIPPTNSDTILSFADNINQDKWVAIWKMQGHTHKLGKNYNIFLRNADGSKGDHIYNGYYDPTHTFNQGYYDYSHPPVLRTEPLMCLNLKDGLIHEATYNNNTGSPIGFGLTTNEEMFVTYYTYLDLDPSEIPCQTISDIDSPYPTMPQHSFDIAPNPSNNQCHITYQNPHFGTITLQLYNMLGEKITSLSYPNQMAGTISLPFDLQNVAAGMYILNLQSNGDMISQRIIKSH